MSTPHDPADDSPVPVAEWDRVEQQATIEFHWVPTTQVQVLKRIVTETQTIETSSLLEYLSGSALCAASR